jgi:hypothetical protein
LSDFDKVKDLVRESDENISASQAGNVDNKIDQEIIKYIKGERRAPFDIATFSQEVADKAENKNKIYAQVASNINAYDVADNCIRQIVYKLSGTPVSSFGDKWLPLSFRSTLGSACHDFIQGISQQFTESEISLKIPSIRVSGRIDNLIGCNVIVEIKSCTYKDYQKIVRDQKPRVADFYQVMTYKYILENYLEESKKQDIKTRTPKPILNEYKIDTIQFIYLAHDITASDIEDFSVALRAVDVIKKQLNSKNNPFYFITSLVLDTNCFDQEPYINFIKDKMTQINWFLDNNKLPPGNNEYVNRKKCFFCHYNPICDIK